MLNKCELATQRASTWKNGFHSSIFDRIVDHWRV